MIPPPLKTPRACDGPGRSSIRRPCPHDFTGEGGTTRSDQFSLAVLACRMLTGRLPYGTRVPQCRALHPDPARRYADVAEFAFALHRPDPAFLARRRLPLIERNPLVFWKSTTLALALLVVALLATR